jgi:hypothetical protein
MLSQWQLFKVAELTFSQLADIPSFIPHSLLRLDVYGENAGIFISPYYH